MNGINLQTRMVFQFHSKQVKLTILVPDHLEPKIISSVLNLCVQPVGELSEVMMTMTTLTVNPITPDPPPTK